MVKVVGNEMTKKCAYCKLFVPVDQDGNIPAAHYRTKYCRDGTIRAARRSAIEDQRKAQLREFTIGGEKLERVWEFSYLGRIIEERDDDTLAIKKNIKKARQHWNQVQPLMT